MTKRDTLNYQKYHTITSLSFFRVIYNNEILVDLIELN